MHPRWQTRNKKMPANRHIIEEMVKECGNAVNRKLHWTKVGDEEHLTGYGTLQQNWNSHIYVPAHSITVSTHFSVSIGLSEPRPPAHVHQLPRLVHVEEPQYDNQTEKRTTECRMMKSVYASIMFDRVPTLRRWGWETMPIMQNGSRRSRVTLSNTSMNMVNAR